jgi:hypothetical protein
MPTAAKQPAKPVEEQPALPALPSDATMAQRADFISQATAVEQARAVAEVQAAVVVAQQCPRSTPSAVALMRESCQQLALAEVAFYRYPRGGETVAGESIHLARELARCFGNIDYGVAELRRDEERNQSEMRVWAWDVQTNTRSSQTFIVPHKRDRTRNGKKEQVDLIDLRDVYENNANMGARRLREAIFAVMPKWFTREAADICTKTLEGGGGVPLADRIASAIDGYSQIGVSLDRLERKLGNPRDKWTPHDVAQLNVSWTSIRQGTITADDEFPAERVTTDQLPTAEPTT